MAKFNLEKELNALVKLGYCPALLYDDCGHWCLICDGIQDIGRAVENMSFFIDDDSWKNTIKEAVYYFKETRLK